MGLTKSECEVTSWSDKLCVPEGDNIQTEQTLYQTDVIRNMKQPHYLHLVSLYYVIYVMLCVSLENVYR